MSECLTIRFHGGERGVRRSFVELTFRLSGPEDFVVGFRVQIGTLHVCKGPLLISSSTMCYGYDLAEFARELEELHARYEGKASFINQLGDLELHLELVDRGRGAVAVEVCYEHIHGVKVAKLRFREFGKISPTSSPCEL